jgi:hypothetical protein
MSPKLRKDKVLTKEFVGSSWLMGTNGVNIDQAMGTGMKLADLT